MSVLPHEGTYPILYGDFEVPVGSGFSRGYLARPDSAGVFPAVIVLHDIRGMASHEKDLCRRFARHGFAALAVDLYRGQAPGRRAELAEAEEAYHRLRDRRVLRDIDETYEFLASEDVEWPAKGTVGLVGLDVGGRLALLYADGRDHVRAVAVAYPPLAGDDQREQQLAPVLERLRIPILGLFGSDDPLVPAESVDTAQQLNPSGDWLLYQGATHDFLNDSAEGYDPAAAADALGRIVSFLSTHLPAPVPLVLG